MNLSGTTTLNTQRLTLRRLNQGDAQALFTLCTDEDILKYLAGISPYTDISMAYSYLEKLEQKYKTNNYFDWAICLKDSDMMIGRITSYAVDEDKRMIDIAWQMNKEYRSKGYMTEAVKEVIKQLSKLGFERIEAFADVDNIASNKVIKKCGFEFEGTLRKYDLNRQGKLYDANMYAIIN